MPSAVARLIGALLLGGSVFAFASSAISGAINESAEVTARDKEHWAFQKVRRPAVPKLRDASRVKTPIDAFLSAKLQASGLTFSQPADAETLLRRAFLDLHGLPPTPAEREEFLSDSSPAAFSHLVDRLLASPRFGERWGRHWLDVVGYADTVGFDTDANGIIVSEGKWKYRDYVIRAFNADKPFDRFLTEQLAGDELVDWRHAPRFTEEIRENLIATGYLRTARDNSHEPESNIPLSYYGVLHDTVEVVSNSLFALTVNCARCHSHKFDPIPQRDYYRLMALFTPAYNPDNWKPVFPWKPEIRDRALPDVSVAELTQIDRFNADVDRDVSRIRKQMAESGCSPAIKAKLMRLAAERSAQRRNVGRIQALYDVGAAPVTHLLKRGQYETPGDEVAPGFLSVLRDSPDEAAIRDKPASDSDSGRRLAFAKWVTRKDSRAAALVSRVCVNRIWQHLFGEGLVRTPENFGAQGEVPTHPVLLEWLAAEFQGPAGWQTKPLVRMLMLSESYQQSSRSSRFHFVLPGEPTANPAVVDPDNHLLWRMRIKRLEAEAIRDCVLASSGRLDSTMGGPPVLLIARPDGLVTIDSAKLRRPADASRRSVYLLSRRAYNLSLLSVFDRPAFAVNCPQRDASVIPLQSLTMLNDEFIAQESEHLASRLDAEPGAEWTAAKGPVIERVFRLVLARSPSWEEAKRCSEYLSDQKRAFEQTGAKTETAARQAVAQLCRTVYNTGEFLYSE